MGLSGQGLFCTAGGAAFRSGANDQKLRAAAQSTPLGAVPVRGSGAPIFIHASRSAISAADSLALGGMRKVSSS